MPHASLIQLSILQSRCKTWDDMLVGCCSLDLYRKTSANPTPSFKACVVLLNTLLWKKFQRQTHQVKKEEELAKSGKKSPFEKAQKSMSYALICTLPSGSFSYFFITGILLQYKNRIQNKRITCNLICTDLKNLLPLTIYLYKQEPVRIYRGHLIFLSPIGLSCLSIKAPTSSQFFVHSSLLPTCQPTYLPLPPSVCPPFSYTVRLVRWQ